MLKKWERRCFGHFFIEKNDTKTKFWPDPDVAFEPWTSVRTGVMANIISTTLLLILHTK